ncbi:MAG: HesA/MoeB/ThiF family protein [Pseudomonadota bacterium]
MGFVLLLMLALWILGVVMKTPIQARLISIALLYVAVLAIQVALPDGHVLREATGGSPALWLILGAALAGVVGYRSVLMHLRQRAKTTEQVTETPDVELERNARHIVLREIGGPGQRRLKEAKVLVIGAGGLGSPVLSYLSAAGVGTIGVIDDDVVDNSNLQRQVIHTDRTIGMPKVFSAQGAMEAQNPFVTVRPYNRRLTPEIAQDLFAEYDLILDGTDNFATRYLVNETAVALGKPLIAAALTQWEGQISLYDPAGGAPCYACVFRKAPSPALVPSCAEAGVLGPLPGVVGSMMAVEAIKEITSAGTTLRGQLLIYDALYGENRSIAIKRRADCPVCGGV